MKFAVIFIGMADATPTNTPMMSKGMAAGLTAGIIILILMFFCCSTGEETPLEKQTRERQEEMRPAMNEMNRKMREGKTREEAAREIVDEEIKRQEKNKK
jgi:hypothetical protein